MAWEPHRNDWYSAEIQKTPEDLRNALHIFFVIFRQNIYIVDFNIFIKEEHICICLRVLPCKLSVSRVRSI